MADKVIGGVRAINVSEPSPIGKGLLDSKHGLYANGRCAFFAVAKLLELKRIWLPSFLCHTMLIPFELLGIDCEFYAVDTGLQPDLENCALNEGDAICLISYFGFAHKDEVYQRLSSCGVIIIEDLCQAFYQQPHPLADFSLKSLRKFFAVPDGAVVTAKGDHHVEWIYQDGHRPDLAWGIEAIYGRTLFDQGLSYSNSWYECFQKSEAAMPVGCIPMSAYTKIRMTYFIDYDFEARRRCENFDYLLSRIRNAGIFKDMGTAVPLGFPVWIKNRDQLRNRLFEHKIYPPVHWQMKATVPQRFEESYELASHIMTLPCDGRYDLGDMQRIVDVLNCAI